VCVDGAGKLEVTVVAVEGGGWVGIGVGGLHTVVVKERIFTSAVESLGEGEYDWLTCVYRSPPRKVL
jgi:hypothetical protein